MASAGAGWSAVLTVCLGTLLGGGHPAHLAHPTHRPLNPPPQAPHTYPFADQVVGEVSGQHVRTKSLRHVLTVNLEAGAGEW